MNQTALVAETRRSAAMTGEPMWDRLWQHRPHTLIETSGNSVGLPPGQMGNSEVGHMNLGAGRVVYQSLTRIDQGIEDGSFFNNPTLLAAVAKAVHNDSALHIFGLLSTGGIHSHEDQIMAMIKHAMGGRAAEELIFGHLSTGAANDLKQATEHARLMVCQYGMSEALGPISLGDEGGDVFLGRDFVHRKEYSEQRALEIDAEISKILRECYDAALRLLMENREVLDRVGRSLLERETLEGFELRLLIEGKELLPLPEPELPVQTKETPPGRPDPEPQSLAGDPLPEPEPIPG